MSSMYYAVRGATTIKEDTRENIISATKEMIEKIISENNIEIKNIESIEFTATRDISSAYPAVAARELGITKAGLMCVQEMYVVGSLEKCIRLLMRVRGDLTQDLVNHVYLEEAVKLRPDLQKSEVKKISIAIDGPSGVGKSTVAKFVSKKLNLTYVDTGAMYRAIGLYCINNSINVKDEKEVVSSLGNIRLSFKHQNGNQNIYLQEEDVTDKIRTQEVASFASTVATYPKVREEMVKLQQGIAKENDVVMDGRDVGSVVLPNATIKIYMTAKAIERANRRLNELKEKGINGDFDEILEEVIIRDYNDKNRENSPLIQVPDAILFDTTNLTLEQSKEGIIEVLKNNNVMVNFE